MKTIAMFILSVAGIVILSAVEILDFVKEILMLIARNINAKLFQLKGRPR